MHKCKNLSLFIFGRFKVAPKVLRLPPQSTFLLFFVKKRPLLVAVAAVS